MGLAAQEPIIVRDLKGEICNRQDDSNSTRNFRKERPPLELVTRRYSRRFVVYVSVAHGALSLLRVSSRYTTSGFLNGCYAM